jgi:phage terminase large subunit-like protein
MPYKSVHASRGKATRAEPIALLYSQGRIHHYGSYSKLEDEMTTWIPNSGDKSPNRIDSLVWGITELLQGESETPLLYN